MKKNQFNISKKIILSLKNQRLLGAKAQDIMLPHSDRNKYKLPIQYKRAAVMILLYQQENQWNLTLIKRTAHPKDKHAGQISLPGGQVDPNDKNMVACAIRECVEEIGAEESHIEFVSSLTEIFVPVSGFMVYPQVAIYTGDPSLFVKQEDEVAEILQLPISSFLSEEMVVHKDIKTVKGVLSRVPCYQLQNHLIWGATAMILSEFKQMLHLHLKKNL